MKAKPDEYEFINISTAPSSGTWERIDYQNIYYDALPKYWWFPDGPKHEHKWEFYVYVITNRTYKKRKSVCGIWPKISLRWPVYRCKCGMYNYKSHTEYLKWDDDSQFWHGTDIYAPVQNLKQWRNPDGKEY